MQINLQVRNRQTRKWETVAQFLYGIYAMEAARTLSENSEAEWRVVDTRWSDDPMVIIYREGVAA